MRNKEKDKIWRDKNKERLLLYNKEWRENNKDKIQEYTVKHKDILLLTSKNWQSNNRKRASSNHVKYVKRRLVNDPLFRFKHISRSLIKKSFSRVNNNSIRKRNKSEELLGCSLEYFKNYILSQCPKDTKLEDFGQFGYHIDHIIPISVGKTQEEVEKLCHYSNFQPLWWKENLLKSNN